MTRFLIAVPLFIIAESLIDDRYVMITSYFFNSGIVPETERSKFLDILSSAQRLAHSATMEIILLLVAFLVSGLLTFYDVINRAAAWQKLGTDELSLAGWWYWLISAPLFQFLLYRWLWRLIIWCVLLWRLSRLNLCLLSTHPDEVCGLGILAESINGFTPIAFAISAVLASVWGKRVVYEGVDVTEFHRPIIVFLLIILLISIAPLLIFTWRLIQVKLRGLHDYGVLANRHSLSFEEKWIRQAEKNMEDVLGTPDVSSLADLGTGFQTVHNVRFFPFRLQNLAILAAAASIPMIPLLLIEIPFREIVLKIAQSLL